MKKLLLSFLAATAAFYATSALAASPRTDLPAGFVKLAPGFCASTRWTGEKYRPWVAANALTRQEVAELARDPIVRESMRRARAERMGSGIASGQKQRCTEVTYYKDPATVEVAK